MKKLISLFLLTLMFSCSSTPEDPLITPPQYNEIPKEEDVAKEQQEIKQDNNEELEQLKKLLLQN